MLVNSFVFWIFFAIVILPYFTIFTKNVRWQNLWLLAASYFFYGWADWKMLPLLAVVTAIYYALGLCIARNNKQNPKKASWLTTLGVVLGIGVLVYFKYLGFFIEEFERLLESFGLQTNHSSFKIIMPVGISFFTFKLMSYVIEVHRENIEPTRDSIAFATFVAFFPTILSGPIDRPNKFLPQLTKSRHLAWEQVSEGLKCILWGMFTKMCVADILTAYTDSVFDNIPQHNATSIIFATILYTLQMYADFSGYSNMAIGVAQIMGLKVAENFNRPFFAQNLAELWRRWHISLTTWLTDYVFMPLNIKFRNLGKAGLYLATLINLVLIGAWHGANWTYVLFGFYHGILLILIMMVEKNRKQWEKKHKLKKSECYKWSRRLLCFCFWAFGQMIFRSNSLGDVWTTLSQIGNGFGPLFLLAPQVFTTGLLSSAIMLWKDYLDEYKSKLHFLHSGNACVQVVSIAVMVCYIVLVGALEGKTFIYFQF